jgi:hypothetical protein
MKPAIFIIPLSILITIFFGSSISYCQVKQEPLYEKTIKNYYGGFEKKDWKQTADQLAEDFTFTSPAPDDHITTDKFKTKCWPQSEHIRRFEFIKIMGNRDEAFAIIHVITMDNKIIHNTEYFRFNNNGRIKSIEVFFGGNGQGYPTNVK